LVQCTRPATFSGRKTVVLLYGDESEALTHPYLARAWAKARASLVGSAEISNRDSLDDGLTEDETAAIASL
jgi:hypothetical protein